MKIYSNDDISQNNMFQDILQKAKKDLKKNSLYVDNYTVEIYLVDNPILYKFQTIFQDTVAFNLIDKIFINKNKLENKKEQYYYLYDEIVHETLHTFQAYHYGGWIKSKLTIPFWVHEGYPVYVSRKRLKKNVKTFLLKLEHKKFKELSTPDVYTLNGLMVKHAIEKMHKSVDDLHEGKVAYNEVLDSLLAEYNMTR